MIISRLIGGLGNQMFQYAVARALAEKTHQHLKLDVFSFSTYKLHNGFELVRIFEGNKELATAEDVRAMLGLQNFPMLKRLVLRPELVWLRSKKLVAEPHFRYWDGLKHISKDAYLIGYWQSEKYFKSIEATVRSDFTFKQPMSQVNQNIANNIAQSNSISLHVRRGDYVQNSVTLAAHGVCSLEYYQAAIAYMIERVAQPKFFIFSDDIEWVKNNIRINFPCQYVENNHGAESYNDMRLMSLCQHHIIANSSFSWWGAWLGTYIKKIVISPKKWFANDNNVSDLFPPDWIAI